MTNQAENFLVALKDHQLKVKKYSRSKIYQDTVYLNWTEEQFKEYSRVLSDLMIKHTMNECGLLGNKESLEEAKRVFDNIMKEVPFNFNKTL